MRKKKIEEVLKEHSASLLFVPDVVGIAQGQHQGNPCISIFVIKKTPELLKQIPSAIEGYMVVVKESGEIRARSSSHIE
ncbi:hypothetical protein ACFLVN_05270 [Chloroflexota bacterium]